MKWKSLILHVIAAMLVGLLITLFFLQNDVRFQKQMEKIIQEKYGAKLHCIITGDVKHINFFFPFLEIKNLSLKAKEGAWQWSCKRFTLSFSWLRFLFLKKIPVTLKLENMNAQSSVKDNNIPIFTHIKQLINQQDDNLVLRNLKIQRTVLSLHDSERMMQSTFIFHTECGLIDACFNGRFTFIDGNASYKDVSIFKDLSAHASMQIHKGENLRLKTSFEGSVLVPVLSKDKQVCFLKGNLDGQDGVIKLYNNDTLLINHDIKQLNNNMHMHTDVHFPILILQRVLNVAYDFPCTGQLRACIRSDVNEKKYRGKIQLDDVGYKSFRLPQCTGTLSGSVDDILVAFGTPSSSSVPLSGSWLFDGKEHTFNIANTKKTKSFISSYWHVLPQQFSLSGTMNQQGEVKAACSLQASNEKAASNIVLKSNFSFKDKQIIIDGTLNENIFRCTGSLYAPFFLKKIEYTTAQNESLFSFAMPEQKKTFSACLKNSFARQLSTSFFKYDLSGKGDLQIQGSIDTHDIKARCILNDANIRLGKTYNFINAFQADMQLNFAEKKCTLTDLMMQLHKGQLQCQRATCFWDKHNNLHFFHAPFIFKKVFLNVEKDVFAIFSGKVLMTSSKRPLLKGTITIDRAQLKQNIFSNSVRQSLVKEMGSSILGSYADVDFDVNLVTRHPIHIKTSFLQSDVNLDLLVKGSMKNPQISGTISLINGSLSFPYKPLYLISGKIYFLPHELTNPSIELLARARIKKYLITMHVSGSAKHPFIQFDASPPLTEQQIVTLLLSGSEEGSLLLAMPSLIMHNVKSLLFGGEQSHSKAQRYINSILSPLKHIRIVPSFNDQTARGGFRATLEINVNDQLRAWFRKNFSLTEDTRFEVEYQVSDDVGLRAIKDERSDLGGEVEMRWKF